MTNARTPDLVKMIEGCEHRRMVPGSIDLRKAGDSGVFEGWGLLWDTRDSYGTLFKPGSFGETLDAEPYALLWMHDPWTVLGTFTAEERDRGLWIAGQYDDTPEGQSARARAKSGSASELSIGFSRYAADPEDDTIITGATLVETSQITARMAAVPGAGLTSVRAGVAVGGVEATVTTTEAGALSARLRLLTLLEG